NLLAVNERWHRAILYMLLALSIRDLCETIVERLKTIYGDPLPSDINIPSDEWILQARMLQKNSEDAHYCAALFCYLREFCEDVAVFTSIRNQRSMVAQESNLAAADHDFTKLSLIPSVIFFISIPNEISGRTEWLRLKNNKFKYYSPASQDAITEVFESIFRIDPTLKIKKTIQKQIYQYPTLIGFIDTHCQTHAYSFQVKKCNNISCLYCKPIRLPIHKFNMLSFLPDPIPSKDNIDHYAAFQNIYGTKTTEEYRPTYMQSQEKSEPIPKSILIAEKIQDYI
ncbi:28130_t:CDS:2, partial [Racocetra persica]